jgi:hypothetical protein
MTVDRPVNTAVPAAFVGVPAAQDSIGFADLLGRRWMNIAPADGSARTERATTMTTPHCLTTIGFAAGLFLSALGGLAIGQTSSVLSLDGNNWQLAIDPQNVGRDQKWFESPRPDAKPTRVPWIIQAAFPAYHGVAWYWRDFDAPANPHPQGRSLLRFWAVDYAAEVWLNDVKVGNHEGSEGVFVLDVTQAIKPGKNRLAVRVLNPTNEPIDGIALPEIPRRCKMIPFNAGALYNDGGIVDSVELILAPPVYLTDLDLRADPKTGVINVRAVARNTLPTATQAHTAFTVAPASSGVTLQTVHEERELPPGDTLIETSLQVAQRRLWELNDPYLYRVTARVHLAGSASMDERSSRCGFRDFCFQDGYFRLNGKRLFLKCSHTATHYPIGQHWPHDPELARRELLLAKAMGFNSIRFFCALPTRYQIDLCDELGLMAYEECFAGWWLGSPTPQMPERFDRAISDMIVRDRNHPSIVMWGLLNETADGPVFRHAVGMLPYVRTLDDTRIVMLNSGLFQFVNSGGGLTGISMWSSDAGMEPNVTYNNTKGPIQALGVIWDPGRLALHPGPKGENGVLRWTAPSAGDYSVSAKFTGIAQQATTDVHMLHGGKPLFDGFINLQGQGNESVCEKTVSVKAGDTIDFVVGWGNGQYGGDSTAVAAMIRAGADKNYDAARDFSIEKNPQGVWSYGYLQPGKTPDASTFKPFSKGETIGASKTSYGALSNPGSKVWEDVLSDQHPYKRVPHTAGIIRELRTASEGGKPVFISEYGIGSGIDLANLARHFEQLGAEQLEDAQWYRQRLDRFLVDWKRWNLNDTFASPEDFFAKSLAKMGRQRSLGLNAIRANPNMVAHSMTGTTDCGDAGEGVVTLFRDLKPGTMDAIVDGWYPLRWCLFAEPVNVYRKTPVRLEAVLANENMLTPGEYPVRVQVVGPGTKCVFDRSIKVTIPDPNAKPEPPIAMTAFAEDVVIDGPPGKYRFLVTFERGAAAAGGETEFYLADPVDLPKIATEVVLWGNDAELAQWLKDHGIPTRPFAPTAPSGREVILAAGTPPSPGGAPVFRELAQRIARGSAVVFLSPAVFAKGDQPAAWVPLAKKGNLVGLPSWLYHKDEWAKNHPIFDGLPAGGLMDYTFYREIISDTAFVGQDAPAEVVAGATNTSQDYSAGLTVSGNSLGAGQFILNTLLVRENLGRNPAADRLLLNMLRHAARDVSKPLVDLPADFETQLQSMGY